MSRPPYASGRAFRDRLYALLCEDERRSLTELGTLAGASSTSVVAYHLDKLVAEGKITRHRGARSIRVVRDERDPAYLAGYAAGYADAKSERNER